MPLSGRTRTVARQTYQVAGRERTAQLRQVIDGPDAGTCFVDYYIPSGRSWRRRRAVIGKVGDFEATLSACIQRIVLPALQNARSVTLSKTPTLAELCTWYTDTVMTSRNNAEVTQQQNRTTLAAFVAYMALQGIHTAAQLETTSTAIDNYAAHLVRRKKPTTAAKELAVIRAVFRAAVSRRILLTMPVTEWPKVKLPERRMSVLTPVEWRTLLTHLQLKSRTYGNVATFIAFVGCRPSDACALQWSHVDAAEKTVLIRQSKTGRYVRIALSAPAWSAIESEKARAIKSQFVFTDRRGKPLTPNATATTLRRVAKTALGREVGPKAFRQYLVTSLILSGVEQAEVQRITGHRSDAIEHYVERQIGYTRTLADRFAASVETTENI